MSMKGSPPVEATLALFSGIVKVGADGTANVEFQLPEFNGTVRAHGRGVERRQGRLAPART